LTLFDTPKNRVFGVFWIFRVLLKSVMSTPSLRTHFLQKREFCQNVHFFGKSAKSDGFWTTLKNGQKPCFSCFLDISGFAKIGDVNSIINEHFFSQNVKNMKMCTFLQKVQKVLF